MRTETDPDELTAFCSTAREPERACTARASSMRLVYLVHDLGDPAVVRRIEMLRPFLQSAVVIGFFRSVIAPTHVAGWPAVGLGRTVDGRLARRALSVVRVHITGRRLQSYFKDATVVVARQLEMLALAVALRGRYAPDASLTYECLDIHRLMVSSSVVGVALRMLEARWLAKVDLLVVSSWAFVRQYFQPVHHACLPPVCLIENKILKSEHADAIVNTQRSSGPPWRIGFAGVLRCRRSLLLLADLTRQLPGKIVVTLHGRPARSAIPDFDELVAAAPGIEFSGPYDRQRDLGRIYQAVHFTWAIDFFEADGNSSWLLPNRLYEGGLHGAVPIAIATVETGRWLVRRNAGIVLQEPLGEALLRCFSSLEPAGYDIEARRLEAVERTAWIDDGRDGARLASALQAGRRSG